MLRVEKKATKCTPSWAGTWTRMDASNREMSASEIGSCSTSAATRNHQRADRRGFGGCSIRPRGDCFAGRGSLTGNFAEQLFKIGLAKEVGGEMVPLRAAVLLLQKNRAACFRGARRAADVR